MSETIQRKARSISGPQTRQAWLNGKGEGAVKKCAVWRDETEIEILGETTVASPGVLMSRELLVVPHDSLLGELSGELREEDDTVGSWHRCVEIGGRRYELDAVAQEHLDRAEVARLTLHLAGASKPVGIFGMFDVGTEVRIVMASTRREYYGTLHCISRQADAYARKLERLERDWRAKNRLPLWTTNGSETPHFNPLPDSAKEDIETEAAVGTYVTGFEDFVDDTGPISPTLPNGNLNEPALLDLLKIGPFRAALEEFYAEEKFSYEQHIAEKKKAIELLEWDLKYSDPDANKPPEVEMAEVDRQMEVLRRRAHQLQREADIRRKQQGLPSRLDLRPEAPESVHRILSDFQQLATFDGYSGYCHVRYEALSDYIDRNNLPEAETRALFADLAGVRNKHVAEKHEALQRR